MSDFTKDDLLRKVEMIPESGCWIFTGYLNREGYGEIRLCRADARRSCPRAHRVAYRLFKGDIPEGRMVCHHCDVRCCVNPAHLYLGNHTDNAKDKARRRRHSEHFTTAQVVDIRRSWQTGKTPLTIAKQLGVPYSRIEDIVTRKTWKHLP